MENKQMLQGVLDYVDESIANGLFSQLSANNLAEVANFSIPHLFRLFDSEINITPVKYVLKRRLYFAAKELFYNDTKIVDIAQSFGFDTHDSFSRAFKRIYSVTPSEFRANAVNINEFYGDLYCLASYTAPKPLLTDETNTGELNKYETICKTHGHNNEAAYEAFYEVYGEDVDVVYMPATKLIGVSRPVGGNSYGAFYEAYDKIFRNASNRRYPNSENATHGVPQVFPRQNEDNGLNYFVGIEVTSFDDVPDGAVCIEMPEQLCAVIGFEGGIDYDTIAYYFAKWTKEQEEYKPDPQKIDSRFHVDYAWKTYHPIYEYYTPNKDCDVYEERIYFPVTPA